MKLNLCIAVLTAFLFFPVFAMDGCFIHQQAGRYAECPGQRAVIIHDGETETLLLQVLFEGSADDFAWIIPVPGAPEETSAGFCDSIFQKLHDRTEPEMIRIASFKSETRFQDEEPLPFEMRWEHGGVGPYEMESVRSVDGWLADNAYGITGEASALLNAYAARGWRFLAFRIMLNIPPDDSRSGSLPPVLIRFPSPKPVYPLAVSGISAARENEIELYLVTRHRMVCENMNTESMTQEVLEELLLQNIDTQGEPRGIHCACRQATAPEGTGEMPDYQSLFREKIAGKSEPVFLVESAESFVVSGTGENPSDPFGGYFNRFFDPGTTVWLTRLRTLMDPEDMDRDIEFIPDPDGDRWLKLSVILEDRAGKPALHSTMALLGMFPSLFRRRKRKEYLKVGILFAMLFWMVVV